MTSHFQKLVICLASGALFAGCQKPIPPEEFCLQGNKQLGIGNYREAEALYSKGIQSNSKNAKCYISRAKARNGLGEYKLAVADCTEALKLTPTDDDAFMTRANSYLGLGEREKAVDDFTEAIKLNARAYIAYVGRARAYHAMGNEAKCIQEADQAILMEPSYAPAYVERARAMNFIGDSSRAIEDASEAIKLDPRIEESYVIRTFAYNRIGQFDKARDDATRVLNVYPRNVWALLYRSDANFGLKDDEKALDDIRTAISIDPQNSDAYWRRARIYQRQGKQDLAQQDRDKEKELRDSSAPTGIIPERFQSAEGLAQFVLDSPELQSEWKVVMDKVNAAKQKRDFESSLSILKDYEERGRKASPTDPRIVAALFETGRLQVIEQGRYSQAEESWRKALDVETQSHPDSRVAAKLNTTLGRSFFDASNYQKAIDYLRTAAEILEKPTNAKDSVLELASVVNELGNSYFMSEQFAKAEEQYRRALKLCPPSSPYRAAVLINLAHCRFKQKALKDALSLYEEASILDPSNARIQSQIELCRPGKTKAR